MSLLHKGAASAVGNGDFPPQNSVHSEEMPKLERNLLKKLWPLHCCFEDKVLINPNPFVFEKTVPF